MAAARPTSTSTPATCSWTPRAAPGPRCRRPSPFRRPAAPGAHREAGGEPTYNFSDNPSKDNTNIPVPECMDNGVGGQNGYGKGGNGSQPANTFPAGTGGGNGWDDVGDGGGGGGAGGGGYFGGAGASHGSPGAGGGGAGSSYVEPDDQIIGISA